MNILKNSFIRLNSLRNFLPGALNSECRFLSSAVEVAPSESTDAVTSAPTYEPDRLYKKIELEIRGNDPAVLKSYSWFSVTAANHLGVEVEKSWPLRKSHKERHTLLKSVHIHKKHRVQYEVRTYFHFIHMIKLTGSTYDTLIEYLERNLPEGVAMKVTKTEILSVPEYLSPPPQKNQ